MRMILYIFACTLFLASLAGHVYVRTRLRPTDPDLDDYYHEFEDQHPEYARYTKWLNITFTAMVVGVLLLFIAIAV
jgi:hypothetical protein